MPRAEPVIIEPCRSPARAPPAHLLAGNRYRFCGPAFGLTSASATFVSPMKTRDFHLPGRSPVYAREHRGDLAPARERRRARDPQGRRQRGRRRRDRRRGAVRGRAGHDRHRRRLFLPRRQAGRAGLGLQRLGPRGRGHHRQAQAAGPAAQDSGDVAACRDGAGCDRCVEAILQAHGRFGLDRVLQPAIRYAEEGFAIAPRVAADWATTIDKLKPHAGSRQHYLVDGASPAIGACCACRRSPRPCDRGGRRARVLPGCDRRRHRRNGPGGRRLAGGGRPCAPPR